MQRKQFEAQKSIAYYFLRAKEEHHENEMKFIVLFLRLTREITKTIAGKKVKKIEPVWVEIEEFRMENAPEKVKSLPECVLEIGVSEKVFHELLKTAHTSPGELYFLTPIQVNNSTRGAS